MYPFLFEIPGTTLRVPAYGAFVGVGFLAGFQFLARYCRREAPQLSDAVNGVFPWVILSSLIGSRVLYFLLEDPWGLAAHPALFFKVWQGGHTFYGGLIAAFAASWWYCRRSGIPFLWFADAAICGVALGQISARIGCFLAGCCWGKPCDLPWAVTFTHPESLAGIKYVAVHPTQLYQAIANLATFLACRSVLMRKRFDGEVLLWYGILYSLGRMVVEIFRADQQRWFLLVGLLTTSQLIALATFCGSVMVLVRRRPSGVG